MHKKQHSHGSGEAVAETLIYALGGAGQATLPIFRAFCQELSSQFQEFAVMSLAHRLNPLKNDRGKGGAS